MQTIKLVPVTRPARFFQAIELTPDDMEIGKPRGRFPSVEAVRARFPDAMIGLPAKKPHPQRMWLKVDRVAWAFVAVLSEWLTEEQMHMVAGVNHDNGSEDPCCASHDYCDANMAMDEAFQRVFGLDMFAFSAVTWGRNEDRQESMSNTACEFWDRAWTKAKTIIETFYLLPE